MSKSEPPPPPSLLDTVFAPVTRLPQNCWNEVEPPPHSSSLLIFFIFLYFNKMEEVSLRKAVLTDLGWRVKLRRVSVPYWPGFPLPSYTIHKVQIFLNIYI